MDPSTTPSIALPILSIAWVYALFVCLAKPYQRFPILLSSYFTVAVDAVLINLWLYATGGFNSPFAPLFYVSIAAVAYRWNGRDTIIVGTLFSASYLALLAAEHDLAGNWAEITVRIGYVFLLAALGALLSGEVSDQIRAKIELRKTASALEESEERLRRLSEVTLEGVAIHQDRTIQDVNHALAVMLGYEAREMIGRSALDFIAPESREQAVVSMAAEGGEPEQCLGLRKDGSRFPIELISREYHHKECNAGVIAIRDVTERIAAENALRESEAKFRALIENASDFIIILDKGGLIRYVSPSVLRMMDIEEGEIVGTNGFAWVHPDDLGELASIFERRLVERGVGVPIEFRVRRSDGTWRLLEAIGNFDLLDSPTISGLILNARDITDRRQAEDAVRRLAYHDVLTGLPNRAFFEELLRTRLSRPLVGDDGMAVLFVDVDHFKLVNDTLGHVGGDELLRTVSTELNQLMREGDIVARVGGDEFLVLLSGVSDEGDATATARRILARLDKRRVIRGRELRVTASIGISVHPGHGDDPDALIASADIAMYEAKYRGRNGYRLYSPAMKDDVVERLRLENELRNAIDREELRLFFQPIVDAGSERIVAAEALLRWRHPERGLVYPDQFVPFASESALISILDEWVLKGACLEASAWRRRGHDVQVTVNLSSRSLQRDDLVDLVRGSLDEAGLTAASLVIEITEGAVMTNVDSIVSELLRLRQMGVHISVDDFGTGYSSLSYLKRFPIDSVKIDRSFVAGVPDDESDAAIVSTIISMAHSLKLMAVAEGVESREHLAFLRSRGCDQLQGYFFAKPMPADAFFTMLSAKDEEPAELPSG